MNPEISTVTIVLRSVFIGRVFVVKYVLCTVEQIVDVPVLLVMEEKWWSSEHSQVFLGAHRRTDCREATASEFGRNCRVAAFEQVQQRIVEFRGCFKRWQWRMQQKAHSKLLQLQMWRLPTTENTASYFSYNYDVGSEKKLSDYPVHSAGTLLGACYRVSCRLRHAHVPRDWWAHDEGDDSVGSSHDVINVVAPPDDNIITWQRLGCARLVARRSGFPYVKRHWPWPCKSCWYCEVLLSMSLRIHCCCRCVMDKRLPGGPADNASFRLVSLMFFFFFVQGLVHLLINFVDSILNHRIRLTADVRHAINRCESLGSGKQLFLHGNPSAIASNFLHVWQSFDVIFPNMQIQWCVLLHGTLGGDFDIFATNIESTTWEAPLENPVKTNWREGLSCSPIRLFQHRIWTRVRGQWLCSGDCLPLLHLLVERTRAVDQSREAWAIASAITITRASTYSYSNEWWWWWPATTDWKDNGNGLDRVSDHILTHKCCRDRKYNLWSPKSLLQIQMKIPQLWIPHPQPESHLRLSNEIAPEENKDPDRLSVHLERTPPHTPSQSG